MSLTPAPETLPALGQPVIEFDANMFSLFGWLVGMPTELDALQSDVADKQVQTAASAAQALIQAQAAATSAAAAALNLGSYQGLWSGATTYAKGQSVKSGTSYWVSNVNGNLNITPTEGANWSEIKTPKLLRSTRTANAVLGLSDHSSLVHITNGTFTQTLSAAAALGAGWFVYMRNGGTGDVTLDPNGAELIDGLTSFVMYPGETRLIQCDGTGFTSVVLTGFRRTWTASGTFTKPPGYQAFGGLVWSAGASGQKSGSATTSALGGAGGGCFPVQLPASALAASETLTVGAGGAAVTGTANGNPGGSSSLGSLITVYNSTWYATGGSIGITQAIQGASGFGSATAAEGLAVYGGGSTSTTTASASSIYGGGGGGSYDWSVGARAPGSSKFGGAGGAASSAGNGTAGIAPGGGGGATLTGSQSGAGARGEIQLWGIV